MKQNFAMNDGTRPVFDVVRQRCRNYPATMVGYQISQVIDTSVKPKITRDGALFPYRYIYEEIDLETDSVVYARFMGFNQVKENYYWFFED